MRTLLLLVLLNSCGPKHDHVLRIEPDAAAALASFEQASGWYTPKPAPIDDLIIEYASLSDTELGHCTSDDNTTPRIQLRRQLLQNVGPQSLEIIVWHELGHCLLGRAHEPGLSFTHRIRGAMQPESVMHPNPLILDDEFFEQNREAYAEELFTQPRGALWHAPNSP